MAKSINNTQVGQHTTWKSVTVPKSAALMKLLQGSAVHHGDAAAEKVLNAISVKADPVDGAVPVVNLLGNPTRAGHPSEAQIAAGGLAALLKYARETGHEAAGQLAALAAQLGVHEDPPAPEPASGHGPPVPSAA